MSAFNGQNLVDLTRDLCCHETGVVTEGNTLFFERVGQEIPIEIRRYPSGAEHNGWLVPDLWKVERAEIRKGEELVFDGAVHPLAVAAHSISFHGDMNLDTLRSHLVSDPARPDAFVYHCMWQYRPWDAGWAFSVPFETLSTFEPGQYRIDLETTRIPGEMLLGVCEHRGSREETIVFNAHTCHPGQANDDMAGVAVLIRLFQWIMKQDTRYSYRLVLGPEHLGTVFYLRDSTRKEIERMVSGVFAEMPGTSNALKVASTFLGDQPIDFALRHAARWRSEEPVFVNWRQGAGNDETVWEAPGYEIPFIEMSRCRDLFDPYPEYHSSLDTPGSLFPEKIDEFLCTMENMIHILESNATLHRRFDGLICLSNPRYDLYMERPDPAVAKDLPEDSERWGSLLDSFLRYMDGSSSILEIADKHDLPYDAVCEYSKRFEEKGLLDLHPCIINRVPVSRAKS